jgi:hypothetical protein
MGLVIRLFTIALILFIPSLAWSDCTADATQASVQSCIDGITSATSGEFTIHIQAGTENWTTSVNVNMNDTSGAGNMTNVTVLNIIGAGIGNTVITDTGTATTFGSARLFVVSTKSGKKVRISGMTLNANTSVGTGSSSCLVLINGTGTETRLDTIQFNFSRPTNGANSNGIKWWQTNGAYGLIDNCTFNVTGLNYGGNPIQVLGAGSGSGDTVAWRGRAFTPGTANATYVENNTFTMESPGNDFLDGYSGARIVARYNTLHGSSGGAHGNDSTAAGDSVHTQEMYNNSYDNICGESECNSGTNRPWAFMWRGGTGVFYNNRIDATGINVAAIVVNYRSNPSAEGTATNATPSSTVLYTTSTTGATVGYYVYRQAGTDVSYCKITSIVANTSITCSAGLSGGNQWSSGDKFMVFYFPNTDGGCDGNSPSDGNVTDNQGWLCRQQVGSTYDSGYVVKPIYAWGNVYNGTTEGHLTVGSGSTRHSTYHVKPNQTFFNCDSAADCKTDTDAVNIPGFGENQGWTYSRYTCPHPLADPDAQGDCAETGEMYGTTGYTLTGGEADTTAPTVTTVYVNGATMTINFSEAITSADNAAFTLDPSGADVTVDCPAVATGALSMACTISRALVQAETATYAYSDTKVIDASSNALANIGTTAITANQTPAEAPTQTLTVNKTGAGCTVTSSPSGISFGGATASDDFAFNSGTVVTLSGYSENGWNAPTFGGDCASNGTVTMSAAKTCTATCTQVYLFP